jgi:hypothetical protein
MALVETGILSILMLLALIYGFTGGIPKFGSRAVKGASLICLGAVAIWVPLSFVAAALLVAIGTRMIWVEVCKVSEVTDEERDTGLRGAGDQSVGNHTQPGLEQARSGAVRRYAEDHRDGYPDRNEETARGVPAPVGQLRDRYPEGVTLV